MPDHTTGIHCGISKIKVKVKESRNSPGVAQSVTGGLGSKISWHSACECGEVVSFTHWPPLPPGMFLVLIFTRGWVDPRAMVWLEGNMSLKIPVTPPGIDPGTVRLVAQHLNRYATPGLEISKNFLKWLHTHCLFPNDCRFREAIDLAVKRHGIPLHHAVVSRLHQPTRRHCKCIK